MLSKEAIKAKKKYSKLGSVISWLVVDPKKIKNYSLPTFTKKIVTYLENHK